MPPIRGASGAMAVGLVAMSVLVALFKPLAGFLALVPEAVTHGFVWQLLTYGLIETSPMGVIFGALITFSIGGALESVWGRRRFLWFAAGTVVIAGVLTTVLSLLVPQLVGAAYPGGTVLTGCLWVAYGLHIGRGQANFWGAPVTGNVLALIGVGFVFLNAAFTHLSVVIPELFGLLVTFFYMRGARPSELLVRFRSWQLERDLKKRSAHLRSLDGGRNVGRDSDRYLH